MYGLPHVELRGPLARGKRIRVWLGRMDDPRLVLPRTHIDMRARVRQPLLAARRVLVTNIREARAPMGALRGRGVSGAGRERAKRQGGRVRCEAIRAALPTHREGGHRLAGRAGGGVRALGPAERDAEVDEHERDAGGGRPEVDRGELEGERALEGREEERVPRGVQRGGLDEDGERGEEVGRGERGVPARLAPRAEDAVGDAGWTGDRCQMSNGDASEGNAGVPEQYTLVLFPRTKMSGPRQDKTRRRYVHERRQAVSGNPMTERAGIDGVAKFVLGKSPADAGTNAWCPTHKIEGKGTPVADLTNESTPGKKGRYDNQLIVAPNDIQTIYLPFKSQSTVVNAAKDTNNHSVGYKDRGDQQSGLCYFRCERDVRVEEYRLSSTSVVDECPEESIHGKDPVLHVRSVGCH